jgi:hypothetical protein
MKITKVISPQRCAHGACPSIILTDKNTVLIQGARLGNKPGLPLDVPPHEDLVSIPKDVFDGLLAQYQR